MIDKNSFFTVQLPQTKKQGQLVVYRPYRFNVVDYVLAVARRQSLNKNGAGKREKRRQRGSAPIKKSKIYDPACRRPRLPVVMSPPFSTLAPDEFVPRDTPAPNIYDLFIAALSRHREIETNSSSSAFSLPVSGSRREEKSRTKRLALPAFISSLHCRVSLF